MKIVLAGATGFIGPELTQRLLEAGHQLSVLTRRPADPLSHDRVQRVHWDGASFSSSWANHLSGVDAVINLSGENIAARRWTPLQKNKIIQSRIQSVKALAEAIRNSAQKPKVYLNASAVGFYGNTQDNEITETSPKGKGFLADTCEIWERTVSLISELGIRTIFLRFGVVLERGGGALAKMLPPFQFFMGGPLGSGKQWLSWIHRTDTVRLIEFALQKNELQGPINVTAPNPEKMEDFCRVLGKILHRPSWLPVPGFALKALLGEMSEILLEGQKVLPQKALNAGFVFEFPHLETALKNILER